MHILWPIGKDRRLCEFNLSESSVAEGLKLSGRTAVEQRAQPTAMALLPSFGDEQFILLANRANKLRLVNSSTKMCRRVVKGPRPQLDEDAASAARILPLPGPPPRTHPADAARHGLLLCGREVVLSRLPPSGTAGGYAAQQASAERADDVAVSHDGSCCFVLSRADESVLQLAIDLGAYEVKSDARVSNMEKIRNFIS